MRRRFKDLVDVPKLQELTDELYTATGIPSAIITMDGEMLTGSGWQRICTDFHRRHPDMEKDCIESDLRIRKRLDDGEPFVIYRCPRGLVDASSPVMIDGEHVANVFAGQLFTEPPDAKVEQAFREQAREFGLDEEEYIKAFREIPVLPEDRFRPALSFLAKFAQLVASIGLTRMRELQAAESLRTSEERFRHLFEFLPIGAFIVDPSSFRILLFNEAAPKSLGYAGAAFSRMSVPDLEAVHDIELVRGNMARVRDGERMAFETRFRAADGSLRDVWVQATGFEMEGQALNLTLFTDITDRKRLEAQLRQSQKLEAIGQLAGGVAHDFNNILAATLMQIGLLKEQPHLDRETQLALDELEAGATRAAGLTRQLLMFSRRSVLDMKTVDLNAAIENVLKMIRRLIGEHIDVEFRQSGETPLVRIDVAMMEQVLMNLAVNARDAMAVGGHLVIATDGIEIGRQEAEARPGWRAGRYACLAVSDTGCGMDADTLGRVFEPFFTTKEAGRGTGLGLATVHGIVAQHDGWVTAESAVGEGTTFRVFIPAAAGEAAEALPKAVTASEGRGSETILLVEDDTALRLSAAKALRSLGYTVIECDDGPHAIEEWRRHRDRIDLLFTDVIMPGGMTGLELARLFTGEKPVVKVIVSSGYSADLSQQGFAALAGFTYLPKPYLLGKLGETVRRCLVGQAAGGTTA